MPYRGPDDVISLVRDDKFIGWRFQNNKNQYKFYHSGQDHMVLGLDEHHVTGKILDYTENDVDALKRIIQHIAETVHLHSIMIKDFNLSDDFSQALKDLGFKTRVKSRVWPVLVRATNDNWFIDGLDIRKVENWELRGICSDNV